MNKIASVLMLFIPLLGFTQYANDGMSKYERRKSRPSYIEISQGVCQSNFRDLATSPLVYKGWSFYFTISKSRIDSIQESNIGYIVTKGNNTSKYNGVSSVTSASFFYSRLFAIRALNSEKWNVKVGGLFQTTGNLRINKGLLNNAGGFEIIPTLFGSVKITKDVSRKKAIDTKVLFMRYKRPERKQNLAFRLNIGAVNGSYRNGFVYIGQSAVLNDQSLFDDYHFSISGFRMSSSLDYKIFMENKNAMKFSYVWDAYKTGGKFESFEMAQHTLRITYMFNTNNK